jgi:hypothetical protein
MLPPNSNERIAMHLRIFFFTLVFCGLPFFAYGGTLREIELIDGSIIRAEVLSMDGKTYRLRSDALGTIEMSEHQIKAIRSPGESLVHPQTAEEPTFSSSPSPLVNPVPTPSANDPHQALSQNPSAMNKIISLQNDPLMQQILGDANTMRAVHAGDLGALMNDPKVRALMNHPSVRELSGQYGQ